MKKRRSNRSGVAMTAITLISGAIVGFAIIFFLDGIFDGFGWLFSIIIPIALFLATYYVQLIVHESGHLVAGLISGYSFGSFRAGSVMILKENGKFKIKRQSIAGTGGQCLMTPPPMKDGKYPVIFYNLGGVLMNALTLPISALLAMRWTGYPFLYAWCVMSFAAALIVVLSNGIPLKLAMLNNDGANALELLRSEESRIVFYNQFLILEELRRGKRLSEMDASLFPMPSDEGLKQSIAASGAVFLENRLMDEGKTDEALAIIDKLLTGDNALIGLHRGLLMTDKISVLLVDKGNCARAEMLYNSTFYQSFRKQMQKNISVLRADLAYALLCDEDVPRSRNIFMDFEIAAASHPYECESESERIAIRQIVRAYVERHGLDEEKLDEVLDYTQDSFDFVGEVSKMPRKKTQKREKLPWWAVLLIVLLTVALISAGCMIVSRDLELMDMSILLDEILSAEQTVGTIAPSDDGGGADYTVINGIKFSFVPDEEKSGWIPYIAALISNMRLPGEGEVYWEGEPALDPDAPTMAHCHNFGLFDVNFDGIPELLAEPIGSSGSNGYSMYCVYDIYSGAFLGEIHGRGNGSIATYYSHTEEIMLTVAFSSCRGGYFSRNEFISTIEFNGYGECMEKEWLSYHLEIYNEPLENGDHSERHEISHFGVHGKSASYDEYSSERTRFMRNYIRIPETAINFYRDSSMEKGCDYAAVGLQIASALVDGVQEIIKP